MAFLDTRICKTAFHKVFVVGYIYKFHTNIHAIMCCFGFSLVLLGLSIFVTVGNIFDCSSSIGFWRMFALLLQCWIFFCGCYLFKCFWSCALLNFQTSVSNLFWDVMFPSLQYCFGLQFGCILLVVQDDIIKFRDLHRDIDSTWISFFLWQCVSFAAGRTCW